MLTNVRVNPGTRQGVEALPQAKLLQVLVKLEPKQPRAIIAIRWKRALRKLQLPDPLQGRIEWFVGRKIAATLC